jgi:hypothetical protein
VVSEASGPPYRDYLPSTAAGPRSSDGPEEAEALNPPMSGPTESGTVFITLDGERSMAIWQGPPGTEPMGEVQGDEETVLGWARSRPADLMLIFDEEVGGHVPLF